MKGNSKMLNVKFYRKQKTLNESLQASGQYLLLEGLVDDVLEPLLKKYKDSADDFEVLQDLGEWPEITPGPKKPNVKALSGPEKAEAFREFNRLRDETKEKNKPKQEEIDRKVKLIKWANLMYGEEGPKDHPPREALPVVHEFLNKLQTMRDKYKSNEDFKKKVDELSSGTSNDPLDIDQFTSDDMREIIEAIEGKTGDIVPDKEQARKDKIGETENWEVFMPTTMPSSCALGKGTTWCTARTRGDNFFYNYVARPRRPIVLFYVIKKNAGTPPKEYPKDYLSLGYRENGEKIDNYNYGGANIDSDNEGVRPEEFASIVGEEESKEVYRIIEKKFETFTVHPAVEKLRMAASDVETFNSLFTKGQGVFEVFDTMSNFLGHTSYVTKEVDRAKNDKIIYYIDKSLKNPDISYDQGNADDIKKFLEKEQEHLGPNEYIQSKLGELLEKQYRLRQEELEKEYQDFKKTKDIESLIQHRIHDLLSPNWTGRFYVKKSFLMSAIEGFLEENGGNYPEIHIKKIAEKIADGVQQKLIKIIDSMAKDHSRNLETIKELAMKKRDFKQSVKSLVKQKEAYFYEILDKMWHSGAKFSQDVSDKVGGLRGDLEVVERYIALNAYVKHAFNSEGMLLDGDSLHEYLRKYKTYYIRRLGEKLLDNFDNLKKKRASDYLNLLQIIKRDSESVTRVVINLLKNPISNDIAENFDLIHELIIYKKSYKDSFQGYFLNFAEHFLDKMKPGKEKDKWIKETIKLEREIFRTENSEEDIQGLLRRQKTSDNQQQQELREFKEFLKDRRMI